MLVKCNLYRTFTLTFTKISTSIIFFTIDDLITKVGDNMDENNVDVYDVVSRMKGDDEVIPIRQLMFLRL